MDNIGKEIEDLNYQEREHNEYKVKQFEKEKDNFLKSKDKDNYFKTVKSKCENIQENNEYLEKVIGKLKIELKKKKDDFKIKEEQMKIELDKIINK